MVFVIAEIGVNWEGNFDLVKEMMSKAKEAGCNAVKFQAFEPEMVKSHPMYERLIKSSISNENIIEINNISKSVGIEWFCTPMYLDAVNMLNPFVKRFKIREMDGRNILENKETELFKKILSTGKEIIISSEKSPSQSKFFRHDNIQWLYCVPKYPCELSEIDFRNKNEFNGFSNHCPNVLAPLISTVLGGKILEIHITSNKKNDFVDNNVSFDYDELSYLMKMINESEKMKLH
jgi:sialic acid synthase SpsE